jgi:hypothetical protein
LFLKLSERLADVAGDGRFLGDDEGLAHSAALLYAAGCRPRNLFLVRRRGFLAISRGRRGGFGASAKANFTRNAGAEFDTHFTNSGQHLSGLERFK